MHDNLGGDAAGCVLHPGDVYADGLIFVGVAEPVHDAVTARPVAARRGVVQVEPVFDYAGAGGV